MRRMKTMKKTIALKIKSLYRDLSRKEKMIADFVLEHPNDIGNDSISDAAAKIGVADSTLFQFAKKMGYQGFKDFKIAILTQETSSTAAIHEKITKNDNELEIALKVFDSNIQTIKDSKALLNGDSLRIAGEIIQSSNMLTFFGLGASAVVAEDGFHKFLRSPITCQHSFDYHNQLIMASLMTEKDCAILISHTGITVEMIKIAKLVKERKGKLIAITSYPHSEIAKLADVVFVSTAEEVVYRSEALASRITQLTIIDALYVITMFKNEELSQDTLCRVREIISKSKKHEY